MQNDVHLCAYDQEWALNLSTFVFPGDMPFCENIANCLGQILNGKNALPSPAIKLI